MTYEDYVKYLDSKCKEEVSYYEISDIASNYCDTSDEYLDNLTSEEVDISQYSIFMPSGYLNRIWKGDPKAMTPYDVSRNLDAMSLSQKMELRKFLVEMKFVDVYKITSDKEICFVAYQSKDQRQDIIEPIEINKQCLLMAPI